MQQDFFRTPLEPFARQILIEARRLPESRQRLLADTAEKIAEIQTLDATVHLLFVCTHNSRRSQFAQFWAQVAVHYFALSGAECFSCGTETTACNVQTINSLQRVGVAIASQGGSLENPHYQCAYRREDSDFSDEHISLFSKAFGHPSLPTQNVVALMCCDDADTRCPIVPGAILRVPLHYVDPKRSDDSPEQDATYDARSLQIASEMFYVIQQCVAKSSRAAG